jgi:ParB-like chromosome segregation protein Spo0J
MENFIKDLSENSANDEFSLAKEIENQLDIALSEISLTQEVIMLGLNDIKVNLDSAFISEQKVSELCESINAIGLLQPIAVSETFELIIGRHRFLAFQKLGLPRIPGIILSLDSIRQQIAELDENLVRRNLSVLERGQTLKRRKELYESLHPETKRGCYSRNKNENRGANEKREGFTRKISAECEISARTAQRLIQIAGRLNEETSLLIRNHPIANRQTDLARLSEMNSHSQNLVAKILTGKKLPSLRKAIEELAQINPDFLSRLETKTSPHKSQKRTPKIAGLAKNITSLIAETENLQNEQLRQLLDSVNLPKRKLENWLRSLLVLINPALMTASENSDKSSLNEKAKSLKSSTVEAAGFSLPFN